MARYYGDFRSIDTSVDPKGQKYRVLIFTNYNGSIPYQYERIDYMPDPQTGIATAPVIYPIVGTALTMTEQPFIVSYEGDADNVFKPYRCSTATVSFRQNQINLDFLNSNGTSTLVVLLKWKNEVSETGGRMYNSETGETLNKKYVYENGGEFPLFSGYEPYKYDRFCYSVEWIGFSTPETFSMDYDHTRDNFTLNAQDAFSVLQYKKYDWIGNSDNYTVSALDVLLLALSDLGTYKNVYITKSLRVTDSTVSPLASLELQQKNWYDEDGKPTDLFSVITEILTYLNLTAIPYKDSLILTNPRAIADGWDYYYTYSLPTSQYFMPFPEGSTLTYAEGNEQNINSTLNLAADIYKSGGMSISTGDIYNSVKVSCDEYPVETTLPEISSRDNIEPVGDVGMKDILFYVNGGSSVKYHWEHQYFKPTTERIRIYQYESGTTTEVDTPQYDTTTSNNRAYSVILDDGGCAEGSASQAYYNPYNPTRKYFFHNGAYFNRPSSQSWKPMLYIKSETMMFNDTDYLQLKGDWKFFTVQPYGNHNFDQVPYQYQADGYDNVSGFTQIGAYSTIQAKVKCGNKWLKNGSVTYGWSNTEQTVNLELAVDTSAAAFNRQIAFNKVYRNFQGIIVKLPVPTGNVVVSPLEIWINQPLGVGSIIARNATLQNLELNILSAEYILTRGESNKSSSNTEYKSEMQESALNEYQDITLKISSNSEKSARYSQTAFSTDSSLIETPSIYQVPTGNFSLPESQITNNNVSQYTTPTIGLQLTVPTGIVRPYSRITWGRMAGRKFILDSVNYDYESDRAEMQIREVKTQTQQAETTQSDTTRRFRRNGDFLTDQVTPRNTVFLSNERMDGVSRSMTVANGSSNLVTNNPIEGLITLSPSFSDGVFLVSIPNDIDGNATTNSDGELIITINDPE